MLLGVKEANKTYYVLLDNLGCVKCLFDNTGALVNRIEYDRLGNIKRKRPNHRSTYFSKRLLCEGYRALHRQGGAVYSPEKGSICRALESGHIIRTDELKQCLVQEILRFGVMLFGIFWWVARKSNVVCLILVSFHDRTDLQY